MVGRPGGALRGDVETLFRSGAVGALGDSLLLERFARRPDSPEGEDAFAALVDRHGPMVLRVCRGVLGDRDDADDAFQAVFLILARQARSIRKQPSVASWLFGVARRVALRARTVRARREATERRRAAMVDAHAKAPPGPEPDLVPEVHDEVARLPEKYRAPVVLHYLEGRSHDQVAIALGLPVGTVKTRLNRARDRLRDRLTRRGLAPSVVAAALVASCPTRSPASSLVVSTVKAAASFAAGRAAGLSPAVASLLKGVVQAMFLAKLRAAALLAAASFAVLFGSLGVLSARPAASRTPAHDDPPTVAQDPPPEAQDPAPKPGDGPDAPRPVQVEIARAQMIPRHTVRVGNLVAGESIDIRPRVSGMIRKLAVDLGDRVEAGQVLAEIDAPEVVAEHRRATAVVDQARVKVQRSESAIRAAEAAREVAEAAVKLAEADLSAAEGVVAFRQVRLEQTRQLFKNNVVDQRIMDDQEEELRVARAAVNRAEAAVLAAKAAVTQAVADIETARGGQAHAKAGVEIARADLLQAEIRLDHTRITTPISGIVTQSRGIVGSFVRDTGDDEPILTVTRTDTVRVRVGVPAAEAPRLDRGDPAIVVVGGKTYRGKVARTAYTINVATQSIETEVDLENPDGQLRPGQQVIVTIELDPEGERHVTIPASAVRSPAQGTDTTNPGSYGSYFVVKVIDGRAQYRVVQATSFGDRYIVYEGLKEGDAVITNPKGVKPDDAVVVEPDGSR